MHTRGPADPAANAEWRRQRRRAAAANHPDRGGDAHAYVAALDRIDRAFGVVTDGPTAGAGGSAAVELGHGLGQRLRRLLRRGTRMSRRRVRGIRSRLPRRAPGARRYIDL